MPVFNGEKYLSKAIESILNQSFTEFEFLIIDDGSFDNSIKIIKKYAVIDSRIKIIRNRRNLGLTKSLNKAILLSKGEFIARQDVDDISLPNRIEKSISFLEKNPEFAFCGTNGLNKQNKLENLIDFTEFKDIWKNLIAKNCFIHPSILIRKDILEKFGYFDESYSFGQDYELWCRLIYKYNLRAKNLKEKLIIKNVLPYRFFKLQAFKFLTQRINNIKTKIKYFKYTRYKFKCLFALLLKLIEIITLSYITNFFTGLFRKINF